MAGLALSGIPVLIVILLALLRPAGRSDVAWFARQHQLALTPENGGMVIDYLNRTHRWRFFGAIGSISAAIALNLILDFQGDFNLFVILFGGWFAGGILAELPVGRRRRAGLRSAVLVQRRLTSFITPLCTRLLAGAWVVGVLAIAVRAAATPKPGGELPSVAHIVRLSILSVFIAGAAIAGIHAVVRRPQAAAESDIAAADRAVRRAAVTRIVAGWIVLQFIVDGAMLGTQADQSVLNWISGALGVVVFLGILAGWAFAPTRIDSLPAMPDPAAATR